MKQLRIHNIFSTAQRQLCGIAAHIWLRSMTGLLLTVVLLMSACIREPELHLPGIETRDIEIPVVDLDLQAYWNYELDYGIYYDWRAEWVYGWDAEDERIFGPIGYTQPNVFNLRRYYTRQTPYTPHTSVIANSVKGNSFHGEYDWGYWDILVWSDVDPLHDDVQSLNIDETTSLDFVTAYTNPTMRASRYQAPLYPRAFYQPEQLFAAYDQAIEINDKLEGFVYDEERNVWVKQLDMLLEPVTYIYLTQVVIHHNRGKIIGVDGAADLSAMAQNTTLNSGVAGYAPITVTYNVRFKPAVQLDGDTHPYINVKEPNEVVAIGGGRMMTFGICNQNGNRITSLDQVKDTERHFMDISMQFNNGMDSTFVFDVTDQVRRRWKGGVITVELDMDTIPVPSRSGGSAFDAVVKDFEDGGTHEFEM